MLELSKETSMTALTRMGMDCSSHAGLDIGH